MTRLAFRMDLLSNRVKGERFWPGFCSLLRSISTPWLLPRSWPASTIRFYITEISLRSPPSSSLCPHLKEGTQGRSDDSRNFWRRSEIRVIEAARDRYSSKKKTMFLRHCRRSNAVTPRLALLEHFTATSRGQFRYSSLTLPWPSLRRNSDLPIPSTGHPSPFFMRILNTPTQSLPFDSNRKTASPIFIPTYRPIRHFRSSR